MCREPQSQEKTWWVQETTSWAFWEWSYCHSGSESSVKSAWWQDMPQRSLEAPLSRLHSPCLQLSALPSCSAWAQVLLLSSKVIQTLLSCHRCPRLCHTARSQRVLFQPRCCSFKSCKLSCILLQSDLWHTHVWLVYLLISEWQAFSWSKMSKFEFKFWF